MVTFGAIVAWCINVEHGHPPHPRRRPRHRRRRRRRRAPRHAACGGRSRRRGHEPRRDDDRVDRPRPRRPQRLPAACSAAATGPYDRLQRAARASTSARSRASPKDLWIIVIVARRDRGASASLLQCTPHRQGHAGRVRQPRPGRVVGHRRRPGDPLRVGRSAAALAALGGVLFGVQRAGAVRDGLPAAAADVRRHHPRRARHGLRRAGRLASSSACSSQLSTLFIPTELKNVGALAVLIVVLLVRPQGILGRAERIG